MVIPVYNIIIGQNNIIVMFMPVDNLPGITHQVFIATPGGMHGLTFKRTVKKSDGITQGYLWNTHKPNAKNAKYYATEYMTIF